MRWLTAILDCYNSIRDEVVKYVGSVIVQREHQNSDLNKRLEEVQSQLLDAQREITRKENLVKERESRVAEINQQLDGFKNQLLEKQQEKSRLENLVQERDTKIAELQQQLNGVRNQLLNLQEQKTFEQHLAQERDIKIDKVQGDNGSTRAKTGEEQDALQPPIESTLAIANAFTSARAKTDIPHCSPQTNNDQITYLKNRQQLAKIIQYSSNYI